ncbi:DUF1540 domain-containing protein [Paenibacillus odorifer]|uniref:DUF1540 domain-containing protein n=2 Tax=Paenibacillus TaxID=44249 RepID=UPI00351B211D
MTMSWSFFAWIESLSRYINWKPLCRIAGKWSGHNEAEVIIMSSEKPLVKCSVSNCHYWGEHNLCRAEEIVIEIDKHVGNGYKEEYAEEMTNEGHRDHASTSSATCCLTFKPNA